VIRHLFRLIWNRRRANALVIMEIFVCFLVLFAVSTLSIYSWTNYHKPLGFSYERVLSLDIEFPGTRGDGGQTSRTGAAAAETPPVENPNESRQRALLALVKEDPAVEEAAWASPLPFSHSNETRSYTFRKRNIRYSMARCSDEYQAVMGIEITRGRWFGPEDDGGGYEPMIITEALARRAFGEEDPIGQSITADRGANGANEVERRVVGVMRAFKQEGEMETEESYALNRVPYQSRSMRRMGSMALRVKPGSDASVEDRLARALQAAAPDWSFKIESMVLGADLNRRLYLAPVGVAVLVALFLILMVALGLSGVLWQSVTTRIREIGVRRALGASGVDVKRQVIGELMVMATIAMLGGIAVVLQFPFLDLLGPVPKSIFFAGLCLTIVALYGLALVCGLHPARLATTVHPAEALRYE
jgi:putative ABC transport system permease protein